MNVVDKPLCHITVGLVISLVTQEFSCKCQGDGEMLLSVCTYC